MISTGARIFARLRQGLKKTRTFTMDFDDDESNDWEMKSHEMWFYVSLV